jgi:hypothetical protein
MASGFPNLWNVEPEWESVAGIFGEEVFLVRINN